MQPPTQNGNPADHHAPSPHEIKHTSWPSLQNPNQTLPIMGWHTGAGTN